MWTRALPASLAVRRAVAAARPAGRAAAARFSAKAAPGSKGDVVLLYRCVCAP